jgi:putative ABC transport system permease protein
VRAIRIDPGPVLKTGVRQAGADRRPASIARTLVAAQVALSVVLLVGSALFVRNLSGLLNRDAGFDREGLLVVHADVLSPVSARSAAGDRAPDLMVWYGELLRRLRETPGVRSASLSRNPPISNELGYCGTPSASKAKRQRLRAAARRDQAPGRHGADPD